MIVESMVDLFFGLLRNLLGGFEIIGLPYQYINVLNTITAYGVWIIGADVMAIFVTTIIAWWTIKLAVGLFVWVWELLPLT